MIPERKGSTVLGNYRIETREEIDTYLAQLRYALDSGAKLVFQATRKVDEDREERFTNQFTVAHLFPNEDPQEAIKRELRQLTTGNYMRTVKDIRFPNRSEMREFGKTYNGSDEVYIKIRVELLSQTGVATFVMSFHYAMIPFSQESFPYQK